MNRKKIFLWGLYTFANSIVFVNFLVYFSKWLVMDGGLSDMAYNLVFVAVAVLLLFSAPSLSAHADKCGNRTILLNIASVGTILAYLAAALAALWGAPVVLAFLFLIAAQYFFQMSYIFYDPLLNDLSDKEHRGSASGIGQFCSASGMIFGLAASLPLVSAGGRLAPLIPSIVAFTILALPMMLLYREDCAVRQKEKIRLGFDWKKFRAFILTSAAAPILIAFFFYTNALNTITNNYSIYAGQVLSITDETTSVIMIVVQIAAALGALAIGFVGDRIGIRRCLFGILWTWLLLIPMIASSSQMWVFFVLAGILGLTIGAGWSASRAYISTNLEDGQVGYGFSFYTIFDRFSCMVGPVIWGGVLASGAGYRAAMLSMAFFVAMGIIILFLGTRKKLK
ncbi:MAG: MFS transporter [Rickettsiales bacterium]|jgi:UMF1 family MFS transporter|nr:MFS transporter [Rickettsiales bacterium]